MDVVKTAVAPADVAHIKRRSRGGCIDCKKAKVKCDEARPTCGTCARRRHVCQGYANTKPQLRWQPPEGSSRSWLCRRTKSVDTSSAGSPGQPRTELSTSCSVRESDGPASELPSSSAELTNTASTSTASSKSRRTSIIPTTSRDASAQSLLAPSPRSLSSIPPGMIRAADEPGVKIYFDRHPFDLVINSEFVEEMNALTLLVLQRDPVAIGNTLAAIGQLYLDTSGSGSLVSPLTRRARTFARLRSMEDPSSELEQVLVMVLGLAAMELVHTKFGQEQHSIPILIGYTASVIKKYISGGRALSSVAKYFVRAFARQDMVLSLVGMRRPFIPTAAWLDQDSRNLVDRLMGYTATLMPLLEEVCALAEDIRCGNLGMNPGAYGDLSEENPVLSAQIYLERARDLSARITAWRPVPNRAVSSQISRSCLAQAYACRSAALLYLYRLLNPPGSSPDADRVALGMACEVLAHLSAPPEELKASLWPAFMAACELETADDRAVAIEVFDGIYRSRKTATCLHTKRFCIERVWKTRDAGGDWNWMNLVQRYPGECIPI